MLVERVLAACVGGEPPWTCSAGWGCSVRRRGRLGDRGDRRAVELARGPRPLLHRRRGQRLSGYPTPTSWCSTRPGGAGASVLAGVVARRRARGYVACDPAALGRDLHRGGLATDQLGTAYDLFPMTHHVECVAILEPE